MVGEACEEERLEGRERPRLRIGRGPPLPREDAEEPVDRGCESARIPAGASLSASGVRKIVPIALRFLCTSTSAPRSTSTCCSGARPICVNDSRLSTSAPAYLVPSAPGVEVGAQ